jgi:dihydroneopterin aldolase
MNAPASPIDSIELPEVELPCRIGVAPGEQDRPQRLRLDLRIFLDLRAAARSGNLVDTVDYADLLEEIEALAQSRGWNLLEELAGRIAETSLRKPGVERVAVCLTKLQPPWPPHRGTVRVRLERRVGEAT